MYQVAAKRLKGWHTQIKITLSTPWRHTEKAEVELHSFLTSVQDVMICNFTPQPP